MAVRKVSQRHEDVLRLTPLTPTQLDRVWTVLTAPLPREQELAADPDPLWADMATREIVCDRTDVCDEPKDLQQVGRDRFDQLELRHYGAFSDGGVVVTISRKAGSTTVRSVGTQPAEMQLARDVGAVLRDWQVSRWRWRLPALIGGVTFLVAAVLLTTLLPSNLAVGWQILYGAAAAWGFVAVIEFLSDASRPYAHDRRKAPSRHDRWMLALTSAGLLVALGIGVAQLIASA